MTFKVKDRDNYGVTFADPAFPNNTRRVKQTPSTKNVSGVSYDANTLEVIALEKGEVVLGTNETISVRVIIKSSTKNQEAAKTLAKSVFANTSTWLDEDVLTGFDPATIPQ